MNCYFIVGDYSIEFNFQIPIPINCIFCIDQFTTILRKVIEDYDIFMKGRMEIIELSNISKQLYRVSSSLFGYIKVSDDDDLLKESVKIERIKKSIFFFILNY